ncbi:MAG: Tol-Pal system beta propeller repeat protein TolB [Proteobacteria bacterium]|nr:Tol-Pal system beta propeller repeat protein TolB [Pseudomonadota bacterium]MBU1715914.1 Tol-Pal system beta propeller repeat protein TolB [Pseudomonadota bacterium]
MRHKLSIIFLSALLLVAGLPTHSPARIYLDISSAELRKITVAVPYFINKTENSKTEARGKGMSKTIEKALAFHGFISIINPELYGGGSDNNWKNLGAEFAVIGQYFVEPEGLMMELRLVDSSNGKMILGRRYRGDDTKENLMLLRFCDEIILKITGEQGVSLTQIAFVSDKSGHEEIYLADVMGDEIKLITRHRNLVVSPRFTPDGSHLLYTSYHQQNPNLYITDLSQSKVTRPLSRRKGLNIAPAVAPDGESMVITLSKDGNPDLYLLDMQGVIKQRLTNNEGINVSPSWSPDGKKLAFVSDRSGTPQIYIMNMKSLTVKRITYLGTYNTTPAWSPKGDWIAYSGRYENMYHIYIIHPEGGSPTKLTQFWGDHESPSWSPDGRQIVFSRRRDNEQKIGIIFRNGSGFKIIFDQEGNESFPQWSPRKKL